MSQAAWCGLKSDQAGRTSDLWITSPELWITIAFLWINRVKSGRIGAKLCINAGFLWIPCFNMWIEGASVQQNGEYAGDKMRFHLEEPVDNAPRNSG